jgi:hypothetical protein
VHKVKSWQDQQLRDEPYTRSYEILKKPSSLLSFRVVVCCVCLSSLNRVTWAEWWPWNAQEKPISRCRSTTQSLSPLFFPPPYRTRVIRYRLFTENSLLFLSLFLVFFFFFFDFTFSSFYEWDFLGFFFFLRRHADSRLAQVVTILLLPPPPTNIRKGIFFFFF